MKGAASAGEKNISYLPLGPWYLQKSLAIYIFVFVFVVAVANVGHVLCEGSLVTVSHK